MGLFRSTMSFVFPVYLGMSVALLGTAAASAADKDADGIADSADNCIEAFNPDQRDSDGDGFGNRCDADLNNDGSVNAGDLGLFRKAWGAFGGLADLDGDGVVGASDLALAKQSFLKAPGPSAHGFLSRLPAARVAQAAAAATAVVTLQPASRSMPVGNFAWPLGGQTFGVVTEGGGVTVQFDAAKLQLVSVDVNTTVWEFGSSVITHAPGNVEIIFASFAGQTGNFPIAQLNFKALQTPGTSLNLEPSPLNPFASGGATFPVSFVDGTLTITGNAVAAAAPVGGAAPLLLAGCLCAIGTLLLATRNARGTRS
jgi:hypothetical protein